MIIGHIGVAYGAAGLRGRAPIWWLFAASLAPDLWRIALEDAHYGPWHANMYSHALPWCVMIGCSMASMAWLTLRDAATAAIVLGLVASHVGLDLVSGWKPLWVGGPHGLDLQHVEQVEFTLEVLLLWLGWRMAPRGRIPSWLLNRSTILVLVCVQAAYSVSYFRARPLEIRCIAYPFAPCWTKL